VAEAASFTSVKNGPWSDPATWGATSAASERKVPGAGDDVFIATGTTVILDTSSSNGLAATSLLNSVNVQSQAVLTCPRNNNNNNADASLDLGLCVATFRIESGGCFSCGYGDCTRDAEPFAGKFVLRLTSPTPPSSTSEDVRTFMVEGGGSLFLSGAPRVRSIARLAADVEAGQATLRLADSVGGGGDGVNSQPWRVGDRVAIGPTDSIPGQTEYRAIVELSSGGSAAGTTTLLALSDPLKYARNGRVLPLINKADNNRQVSIDTRAEVALLSRNVVIEGTNDAVTGLGGDLMMMGDNVRASLSWVELRYLGRRGHLARYPLHIHNLGDSGRDVYVSNVAIHSSFQRGVVIHCTNGVTLINNTVAGSPGFAYMLEDGAEENNILINNYALDVKPADYPLIQTERVNSAGFWFVNAANTFVGNVAAGVSGVGFSLDMDPVLGARPSTLSTCPQRLPGYNATLARDDNVDEFNKAVNTALIKKNFVRFDDNVVHSAHSGLWMSYPFTPMFFVDRPTPIVRFTAWNIAARQTPPSLLDSSDGVSLQFDGCIRLQGQRGMHIYQPTCVNSESATWASCVSTFDGLTVAWVGDDVLTRSGASQQTSNSSSNNNNISKGVMFTHLEPQVFLRTEVIGSSSPSSASTAAPSPPPPLFTSVSKGGSMAALNTLAGTGVVRTSGTPSLIRLNAGDMHVFTDAVGDAFGAGPGAAFAATYANASGVDPLIEAYAPGRCTTGTYASNRKWPHVSSSALPSGRAVAVNGGLPMLCSASPLSLSLTSTSSFSSLSSSSSSAASTSPLRFVAFNVDLRGANWVKIMQPPVADMVALIPSAAATAATSSINGKRRVSSFPVMLPLSAASMDPWAGGYVVAFAPETWAISNPTPLKQMDVILSSTIHESDGMTFVLTGLPSAARVSKSQPGGPQVIVRNDGGTSLAACRSIISTNSNAWCDASKVKQRPVPSVACVCVARGDGAGGDGSVGLVVRFQAAGATTNARSVGLFTSQGKNMSIFDFPPLRMDLV
jgi:hypothetical protein